MPAPDQQSSPTQPDQPGEADASPGGARELTAAETETAAAGVARDETPTAEGKPESEREGSFLREVPVLVLIAFVVAILLKGFVIQAFYIPSASMEPTLVPGDRVLVNKVVYHIGDIQRQNVIVFRNPDLAKAPKRSGLGAFLHWIGEGLGFPQAKDEDLIKRVIGLPGDVVQLRRNTVFVNGTALSEPYLTEAKRKCNYAYGPVTVPRASLFVLGDNRCNSEDSRFIGFIPEGDVVGRAFVVIWPPSDVGGLG